MTTAIMKRDAAKHLHSFTARRQKIILNTAHIAGEKLRTKASCAMIKPTTLQRAARLVAQSDKRRAVQGAIDAFKRNDARALDDWFKVLNMAERKLSCAQN